MRVLLFSDPHLTGDNSLVVGQRTDERLRACLDHARATVAQIEHTVFLGDLSDSGGRDGYVALRDMMADWPSPVTYLMGNEDSRETFRDVFPESVQPGGGLQTALEIGDHTLLCLDTLDDAAEPPHSGRLHPCDLDWLDKALANMGQRQITVLMHHPPLPVGLPFFDRIGLQAPEPLLDRLRASMVSRVITGHVHRAITVEEGALSMQTLPSTEFGLVLGPGQKDIAPDPAHQPGYGVLTLKKDAADLEIVTLPS